MMRKRKGRKEISGEVLSFTRTFTRGARLHKKPSEEKMVKGILRQIERKAGLKKAFRCAWGRPPTPAEISSLRTRTVIETKMRPLGRYIPDMEVILLKNLDPRTIMHEWTHFVELSHLNTKKRIEYIYEPKWHHRVESELYGILSEVAADIIMAQRTGVVNSSLRHAKKKLTPKEKHEITKKVLLSWERFLKTHSSVEGVRKIASNKKREWKEFAAYACAYRIAHRVIKDMLKEL